MKVSFNLIAERALNLVHAYLILLGTNGKYSRLNDSTRNPTTRGKKILV